MVYMGDNYHRCAKCLRILVFGEVIFHSKRCARYRYACKQCSERKNMPNIKITAEVNGKQVPLETVSTETFEAIKALEKPKEIPAIAIGNYKGELHNRRLFIKINESIKDPIVKHNATMVVIDPKNGQIVNWWTGNKSDDRKFYENIKPL
ncbi:hypothetical protein KAR91_78875 [Candidatus Pacearchaeota archaeon]|nr:hypothetical protein [Candidatus Pacearchaeota archaeon]